MTSDKIQDGGPAEVGVPCIVVNLGWEVGMKSCSTESSGKAAITIAIRLRFDSSEKVGIMTVC